MYKLKKEYKNPAVKLVKGAIGGHTKSQRLNKMKK